MVVDLISEERVERKKIVKPQLQRLVFSREAFGRMMSKFASEADRESACFLSGIVVNGTGHIERFWDCEVEFASLVNVEPSTRWLLSFMKMLRERYSHHNVVVAAHRHPIGSQLSQTDIQTLQSLTAWNEGLYFVEIGCDIDLGSYIYDNRVKKVEWEVEKEWTENKPSQEGISSTTSGSSWDRFLQRLGLRV